MMVQYSSTDPFCIDVLKALSNQTRMSILAMTVKVELSQRYLAKSLETSESSISQHVSRLVDADLVSIRRARDGRKYVKAKNSSIVFNLIPIASNSIGGDRTVEDFRPD